MIETFYNIGANGQLRVRDSTDGPQKTVQLALQSSVAVSVPQLSWSYDLDAYSSGLNVFNFQANTLWQILDTVYGDDSTQLTFNLSDTGTVELGGASSTVASLYAGLTSYAGRVSVRQISGWKPAEVYVKDGDIWKLAIPYVRHNGVWQQLT